MSDLGLPEGPIPSKSRARSYVEYRLDKDLVLPEFFSIFKDADLTFGLAEPTPDEMEQAGKIAGSNSITMAKELLFKSIIVIGGQSTKGTRDPSHQSGVDAWWDLIGAKQRDMVTSEFSRMMVPSEEEANRFQATRRVVSA